MAEENYGFAQTKARLEDIVTQVRKKDVSLEKSLDLLEEGVRLANQCTELIDHADWEAAEAIPDSEQSEDAETRELQGAISEGDDSPNGLEPGADEAEDEPDADDSETDAL